jgi:hypothetical protein
MTMHLAHPALSMGGKRKGKQKFRNAEQARNARALDAEWEQKQKEWAKLSPLANTKTKFKSAPSLSPQIPAGRDTTRHIPSRVTAGGSTAPVHREYTGDKIIGIATLHKSNAVPVFSQDEAVEISRMRRG